MDRSSWPALILLAALTALAAWLRLAGLAHGFAPDEFANLYHGGAWGILTDPESGVNPPLLRLLFNVPFDEPDTFRFGRWFTFAMGVLTVPLGYELGRRASGGSRIAGLATALLFATHPYGVQMSARFRAYTPWMATMLWHLIALSRWLDATEAGDDDAAARARRQVTWSAALLPWWHYFSVPILGLLGLGYLTSPRLRPVVKMYVPAGLLVAPMAWLVLADTSARVEHSTPLSSVFTTLLGLAVQSARPVTQAVKDVAPWWPGEAEHVASAWVVGSVLIAAAVTWRRARELERVLLWGALGTLLGVVLLSRVQLVRTPTALMLLVFVAPILAGLPARLPKVWQQLGLTVCLLGLYGSGLPDDVQRVRTRPVYDALRTFTASWHTWDAARGDGPIHTWPGYTFVGAYYYLTGLHVRAMVGNPFPECGDDPGCFAADGVRWLAMSRWDPDAPPHGLVAAFSRLPEGFGDGCTKLEEGWQFSLWSCP